MNTKDFFVISRLHRDDIVCQLENRIENNGTVSAKLKQKIKHISDEDMEGLASCIGEALMNSGVYWEAIDAWVDSNEEDLKLE